MNYFVDWTPLARSQLATEWLLHKSFRKAITAAQARMDQLLAADPHHNVEHVSEGLYDINVPPLRGLFEVDDNTLFVRVNAVRWRP
jgi:hypothetical protein